MELHALDFPSPVPDLSRDDLRAIESAEAGFAVWKRNGAPANYLRDVYMPSTDTLVRELRRLVTESNETASASLKNWRSKFEGIDFETLPTMLPNGVGAEAASIFLGLYPRAEDLLYKPFVNMNAEQRLEAMGVGGGDYEYGLFADLDWAATQKQAGYWTAFCLARSGSYTVRNLVTRSNVLGIEPKDELLMDLFPTVISPDNDAKADGAIPSVSHPYFKAVSRATTNFIFQLNKPMMTVISPTTFKAFRARAQEIHPNLVVREFVKGGSVSHSIFYDKNDPAGTSETSPFRPFRVCQLPFHLSAPSFVKDETARQRTYALDLAIHAEQVAREPVSTSAANLTYEELGGGFDITVGRSRGSGPLTREAVEKTLSGGGVCATLKFPSTEAEKQEAIQALLSEHRTAQAAMLEIREPNSRGKQLLPSLEAMVQQATKKTEVFREALAKKGAQLADRVSGKMDYGPHELWFATKEGAFFDEEEQAALEEAREAVKQHESSMFGGKQGTNPGSKFKQDDQATKDAARKGGLASGGKNILNLSATEDLEDETKDQRNALAYMMQKKGGEWSGIKGDLNIAIRLLDPQIPLFFLPEDSGAVQNPQSYFHLHCHHCDTHGIYSWKTKNKNTEFVTHKCSSLRIPGSALETAELKVFKSLLSDTTLDKNGDEVRFGKLVTGMKGKTGCGDDHLEDGGCVEVHEEVSSSLLLDILEAYLASKDGKSGPSTQNQIKSQISAIEAWIEMKKNDQGE